jgi:type II secretory pathway pseudopilin PulG
MNMGRRIMESRERNEHGFTLIEMAIILMILGVLVTMGAGMMGTLTKRLELRETREAVNNAAESIAGYAAATGLLPGSAIFSGVVTRSRDSWDNALNYIPAEGLVRDGICVRKTTGLSIMTCAERRCSNPSGIINDVAYVIISGGDNYNIQTALKRGTLRVYDQGIGPVDDYDRDMSRAEQYDDVVTWATLYDLRVKAGCSGPQMRIINSSLPSAADNDKYLAEVFADGGVPYASSGKYRWCVETKDTARSRKKSRKEQGEKGEAWGKGKKQGWWLKARPSTIPISSDCNGLSEEKWGHGDSLRFEGTAKVGTTALTVFARDDNDREGPDDNIASRAFVIIVGK